MATYLMVFFLCIDLFITTRFTNKGFYKSLQSSTQVHIRRSSIEIMYSSFFNFFIRMKIFSYMFPPDDAKLLVKRVGDRMIINRITKIIIFLLPGFLYDFRLMYLFIYA